jgi:hypothetical protein
VSNDDRDPDRDPGQLAPIFDGEEVYTRIRHAWHDGRWFWSVIDVIALLTESRAPRRYWRTLKARMTSPGAQQTFSRIVQLKMLAADGKMRYADYADAGTLRELRRFVPGAAAWRHKTEPEGIVYAIGLQDGSMVKIGITTNLTTRLRDLRHSSPVPIVLLWQTPGASSIECELHVRFAHRRAHGEWFSFAGADVIAELQAAVAESRGHAA